MKSERTFATFRVAGDSLVPAQLTKPIGMSPTLAYGKGERYRSRERGQNLKGRTGVWFLSTDDEVQSNQLNDYIDWLFSKINQTNQSLDSLSRKTGSMPS